MRERVCIVATGARMPMEWLDSNRQFIGSVSRSGFVPGEGAGVCMLLSETAAYRRGLRPLAWVAATATGARRAAIGSAALAGGIQGQRAPCLRADGSAAVELPISEPER